MTDQAGPDPGSDDSTWLTDPGVWQTGVPHDRFAHLRAEAPVSWHEHADGLSGFWSVNRHADVVAVSRDPTRFSSRWGVVTLDDLEPDQLDPRRTFLEEDPPRHSELRALVEPAFTQRAVAAFTSVVEALADETLDRATSGGSFDLVETLAEAVPIRVLAHVLGLDPQDGTAIDDLVRWGNALLASPPTDPDGRWAHLPFGNPVALDVFALADRLARDRRGAPADDVTSRLVHGLVDGAHLSEAEYRATWLMLVIAGNETTRHAISHGVLALAEHPDQLARWRADPSLTGRAVDEVLRWATPINWHRRQVVVDAELGGRRLSAGDKLILSFTSANRDEATFEHPDRFDIGRRPNPHVTFGRGGPHFCLGAHLARLELSVLFARLVTRVRTIEVDGPVERLASAHLNGIVAAPVVFTAV